MLMAPDFTTKSSGLNGDVNCKFNLTNLDSIRDTFQFLSTNYPNFGKDKICVISIIGKSSIGARACKSTLIDDCLGKNVFRGKFCDNKQLIDESTCHVEGYFDSRNRVIFLHLISPLDTDVIVHIANSLDHEFASKELFQNFTDFTFKTAKILLFLFIISHIVVIVNPTPHFDLNYLQLFRLLDITRIKTSPLISEILRDFRNISDDWVFSGRPCSPRVLFVFEAYSNSIIVASNKRTYEQHLEDQIYRFLRKSRIITNICANSLFAICNQSDFVYISTQDPTIRDAHEFLQSLMIKFCSQEPIKTSEESNGGKTFYQFLWSHISTALAKGFDDNVGRHNAVTVFELPVAEDFFLVTEKLHHFFFNSGDDPYKDSLPLLNQMRNSLDIDTRFSEARCSKVLPIAFSIYQEGLPSHYTSDFHVRKVTQAMHFFTVQSRGPALYNYLRKLKEDCDNFWNAGRQMCEVLSLTGNNCINPVHRTKPEDDDHYDDLLSKTEPHYQIMPHCSGVKVTSACDCGRRQANRDDPFTVKSANHDFYYSVFIGKCNCTHLERIEFPIFQPSTADIRPAKLNRFFDRFDNLGLDSDGTEPESQPGTDQASLTDLSQAMVGEQSLEPFRRTGVSAKESGQSGDKSVDPIRNGVSGTREPAKGDESLNSEIPQKVANTTVTNDDNKTKSTSVKSGGSGADDCNDLDNSKSNTDGQKVDQVTKCDMVNQNGANGGEDDDDGDDEGNDEEGDDDEEEDEADDVETGEGVDKGRDIQLIIREYNRSPHLSIFNQHSTIEYLPGMLHSQSPTGLLPKFSSWSLVCLGPSSLYSHNMGVQDQPGFISGTNFLLPWDVTVKLEHSGQLPPLWEGKRPPGIKNKKTLKDGTQFTVKIFIGVEYECPRGHRFMSSKPASVLKANKGIIKENANSIASNDMPIYIPCVCSRSGKLLYGQLMRLHVVTPKAPVHVTLNPRVQPAPNPCPIFSPGNSEPVKLTQSAYWILRLPFVYQGDHGVYMPYKDRLDACRLLKGTYGISDYISKPKK